MTALLSGAERSARHRGPEGRELTPPAAGRGTYCGDAGLDCLQQGEDVEQNAARARENNITSSFLLQVLPRETAILEVNPTLGPHCHFHYTIFFMFYMNNINLLIKITELSIEKVSN